MLTYSRTLASGCDTGAPIASAVTTRLPVPTPSRSRPGASASRVAAWLSSATGCRVKAGTIAVPTTIRSVRARAAANKLGVS